MRRQVLVTLTVIVVMTTAVSTALGGCGGSEVADTAGSSTSTTTVTVTGDGKSMAGAVLTPGEGLVEAKRSIARALGFDTGQLRVSSLLPSTPGSDTVLVWDAGRAEIDSYSGRVFVVSCDQGDLDQRRSPLSDVHLTYTAGRVPASLGWDEEMLGGMGFKRAETGTMSDDTGLFSLTWDQYDPEGSPTGGFLEVYLDAGTARLVGFSVSPAGDVPDISGVINAGDAMAIAETEIYLKTTTPRIPMTADGSLILLGKSATQELKIVEDRKITRGESVLTWVISLSGTVGGVMTGGTVYVDAMSGEILAYEPLAAE